MLWDIFLPDLIMKAYQLLYVTRQSHLYPSDHCIPVLIKLYVTRTASQLLTDSLRHDRDKCTLHIFSTSGQPIQPSLIRHPIYVQGLLRPHTHSYLRSMPGRPEFRTCEINSSPVWICTFNLRLRTTYQEHPLTACVIFQESYVWVATIAHVSSAYVPETWHV